MGVLFPESGNTYNGMKKANYFMGPSLYETVQLDGVNPVNVDQRGIACGDAGTSLQLQLEILLHLCFGGKLLLLISFDFLYVV